MRTDKIEEIMKQGLTKCSEYSLPPDIEFQFVTSVAKEISELDEWVKCSDRLPENDVFVMALKVDGGVCESSYVKHYMYGYRWESARVDDYDHIFEELEIIEVTHWQPLPQPPKQK